MIEQFNSIWNYYLMHNHFICLTTNGELNSKGWAIMGAGNAKQATIIIPGIARLLGQYIEKNGNVPGILEAPVETYSVIIFPVKHRWSEKANVSLICTGVAWLFKEANSHPEIFYHLPRPGCGNGKLNWEKQVRPIVKTLPDNVMVHHIPNVR